jgi:hypothetical protein
MRLKNIIPTLAMLALGCMAAPAQVVFLTTGNAPVANAGPDRPDPALSEPAIVIGASGSVTVQLDGSLSDDIDGDISTLVWTDGTQTITGPFPPGLFPVFTYTTPGVRTITLTVTDATGLTSTDTMVLTISGNTPVCLPTLVTPAKDKCVECDGCGNQAEFQAWLNNHGGAVATDPCETLCWSHNYTCYTKWVKGTCPVVQYVSVTFKAKDAAGHFVTTTAKFKILDTTPPPLNWKVNGCAIPDYTIITINQRELPVCIKVTPNDICSTSTLKKSYKFLCGSGCVQYSGSDTVYITSASVGAKVRVYFQATDKCGNSSACEWVEIDVVNNCYGHSRERCREGLDDDDECERWDPSRRDCDYDFPSYGYRYCDDD